MEYIVLFSSCDPIEFISKVAPMEFITEGVYYCSTASAYTRLAHAIGATRLYGYRDPHRIHYGLLCFFERIKPF